MSIRASKQVWDLTGQHGSALVLLLALADFTNEDGVAYPSVRTLARRCRTSVRNVGLLLARLVAAGELQVLRGRGPCGTNIYRLVPGPGQEGAQRNARAAIDLNLRSGGPVLSQVNATSHPSELACRSGVKGPSVEPSLNHQGTKGPAWRDTREYGGSWRDAAAAAMAADFPALASGGRLVGSASRDSASESQDAAP